MSALDDLITEYKYAVGSAGYRPDLIRLALKEHHDFLRLADRLQKDWTILEGTLDHDGTEDGCVKCMAVRYMNHTLADLRNQTLPANKPSNEQQAS